MNSVALIGRLTRDPEVRYSGDQMAIATFSIAIDRPPRRDGTKETDFPRITVFGRQAENCEKYLRKGRLVGVTGRIQTGSYTNREGQKVYTTDVVADRVEFLEWGDREGGQGGFGAQGGSQGGFGAQGGSQGGFGAQTGAQGGFGAQTGGQGSFGGQTGGQGSFGGQTGGQGGQGTPGGFGGGQADSAGQQPAGQGAPTGFAPIKDDDIPF